MTRDPYARELRRQAARTEAAERRLAMASLTGKVKHVDADKRLLQLTFGTDEDGSEILSPWIRWQEAGNGGLSIHSEPAEGEQMTMVSQSGTVGATSIAVPSAYDKDHAAPSKSSDTAVFARGEGRIEIGAGGILLKGPVKIEGATTIEGSGLTHNGKNVGDDHAHKDVTRGSEETGPPA